MQDTVLPPGCQRGAPIPWWGKIAAKLILHRLPVPHSVWSTLNVFRHSYSAWDPAAQVAGMQAHVAWFKARTGRIPRTVLELGPGEVTTRAVVNRALGIERTIFVDVGDFGTRDIAHYVRVAETARRAGLDPPDLAGARDRAEVFARCGAEYHFDGVASLARLPDECADFVLSEAVIEHIRWHDLAPAFGELRRLTAPDGLGRHAIDFQDHMGGMLNNLRFSSALWESEWMASSGFYTNRASASEVLRLMRAAGFDVEVEARNLWHAPPTDRARIARDLQAVWSDEDLIVRGIKVAATPARRAATQAQKRAAASS
jgi:SAM-dependent methyltransferase